LDEVGAHAEVGLDGRHSCQALGERAGELPRAGAEVENLRVRPELQLRDHEVDGLGRVFGTDAVVRGGAAAEAQRRAHLRRVHEISVSDGVR
jgi:hypothetical protein